jgi:aminoglycoside/choline kinase family phosphotransferase
MIAFARESLGLNPEIEPDLAPLDARGSDRAYYRLRWSASDSAILMHYQPTRIENSYYADIAQFLRSIGILVPQVIRHDENACLILQEDLGTVDLWALRDEPWPLRKSLYQKTLTIVHKLHSYPAHDFPTARVPLMEAFGPALYRWERDYFRTNFIGGLCELELDAKTGQDLEKELAQLAERLTQSRRSLVHRDLQSQNVMICEEVPFLIDFQGMRFGNRFYDLGSLLCDPYVSFTEGERLDLLSFYYGLSRSESSWDYFKAMFWEASAQRLMQALGAYGFLANTKGLKDYLQHVPAGLRNLRLAAENAHSLPKLLEICHACEKGLSD